MSSGRCLRIPKFVLFGDSITQVLHRLLNSKTHAMSSGRCLKIPKFVLLGASITQRSFSPDGCWGAMLADSLVRRFDVVNRGFSGYNTRWCNAALPRFVNKDNFKDIVGITILLGANDSTIPDINIVQNVPLEEYEKCLKAMLDYLLDVGFNHKQIIVVTPPVNNPAAWEPIAKQRGFENSLDVDRVQDYANRCRQVAEQTKVTCVDLYTAMKGLPDYEELLVDGLHLSKPGSELLYNLLWPHVDELTKDLPTLLPLHDEINILDPESHYQKLES